MTFSLVNFTWWLSWRALAQSEQPALIHQMCSHTHGQSCIRFVSIPAFTDYLFVPAPQYNISYIFWYLQMNLFLERQRELLRKKKLAQLKMSDVVLYDHIMVKWHLSKMPVVIVFLPLPLTSFSLLLSSAFFCCFLYLWCYFSLHISLKSHGGVTFTFTSPFLPPICCSLPPDAFVFSQHPSFLPGAFQLSSRFVPSPS